MEGYQGAGYGMEHNKRRRIKIRRAQKFKGLTDSDPEHWFRQVFQMHPVGVSGVWVRKL